MNLLLLTIYLNITGCILRIIWIWFPTFVAGETDILPGGVAQTLFLLPIVCWFGGLSLLYGFWFDLLQLKSKTPTKFLTRTKYVVFVLLIILFFTELACFGISGVVYDLGTLMGTVIMAIYILFISVFGVIFIKIYPRLAGVVADTHRRLSHLSKYLIIGNILWAMWICIIIAYFFGLYYETSTINIPNYVLCFTYILRLFEFSFSFILLLAIEHDPVELAKWVFFGPKNGITGSSEKSSVILTGST